VAPGCLGHTAFATLVRKPRTVAFREAATAPTVYCTVFTAFADGLSPSDTVWSPVCHAPQHSADLHPNRGSGFRGALAGANMVLLLPLNAEAAADDL